MLKRSLFSLIAVMTVLAAACGGGDKKPAATAAAPTEEPAASTAAKPASETPSSARTATPSTSKKSQDVVGGLFSTLFTGALSGGGSAGASGLGDGDPALKQYLPSNADLPNGYTPQGQFTFRAPDGVSSTGGIDIAAEIAVSGDATANTPDFAKLGMLMAMVMKPDDLQSLGSAFDSIKGLSEKDLEDALLQGGGNDASGLFSIKNVKVLDAPGLGDGGVGFQMTIDLGGLASVFNGLGGDSTPATDAPDLSKLVITMRMYLFARGDYAGGILRMAFADSLPGDVDEVALAKIIDGKLKAAR